MKPRPVTRLAGRRKATRPAMRQRLQYTTLLAPLGGMKTSQTLVSTETTSARNIENWFCELDHLRVRAGSGLYATLDATPDPVESLFTYRSGSTEKFFGASDGNVFDITTVADAEVVPSAAITGQTADYYTAVMMGTAGGDYMYILNGADRAQLYDGTSWTAVDDADTELPYDTETGNFTADLVVTGGTSGATATIVEVIDNGTDGTLRVKGVTGTFQDNETITDTSTGSAQTNIPSGVTLVTSIAGVETTTFSYGWKFAERLFFVENGTQVSWYLPADSIGGTAADFSLAGIFQDGAALLFGATFSFDSGSGMDDRCVFVSAEGDVAVYEGTNPASAADWSRVGLYKIAKPLGKNAHFKAGGDLVIATVEGLVPMSQVIVKDPAALSLSAVSFNIEDLWRTQADTRASIPWEILKWDKKNMLVVSQPVSASQHDKMALVSNLESGAWSVYTGWDVRCVGIFNDVAYFGNNAGQVVQMETGGDDVGEAYTARLTWQFNTLGRPGLHTTARMARTVYRAGAPFIDRIGASTNYNIIYETPPDGVADYTEDTWDSGLWDTAVWDAGLEYAVTSHWRTIGESAYAVAPQVQITISQTPMPRIELVAMDVSYEQGGLVV